MTAADTSTIPVVDFAGFGADDPARSAATTTAHPARLRGRGIPLPAQSRRRRQRPGGRVRRVADVLRPAAATKEHLRWDTPERSVGYIGLKGQVHDADQPYDLMEAYNAGYERDVPANPGPPSSQRSATPCWASTWRRATSVERLMQAIASAFGLPERYFEAYHAPERGTARLLHYPPLSGPPAPVSCGRAPHTDFGTITLLFQDKSGGLEIRRANGTWQPADAAARHRRGERGRPAGALDEPEPSAPRPTAWSIPRAPAAARSRYSCVFFYSPNHDAPDHLPGALPGAGPPALYPLILTRDHMRARHEATYRPNDPSTE